MRFEFPLTDILSPILSEKDLQMSSMIKEDQQNPKFDFLR